MITVTCKQGSPEWHLARLGIPTASQIDRILSAKTLKPLAGSEGYMHELLAEWATGIPSGAEARDFMARGNELEPWAVDYYQLQRDVTVTRVGTCLRDDRMVAASPDFLVGADGGGEIKCPSAQKHIAHMLGMRGEYFLQVQGNLWITGRRWWDLISYHPVLAPVIVRIERDEATIAAINEHVSAFVERLLAAQKTLMSLGVAPMESLDENFAATLDAAVLEEVAL